MRQAHWRDASKPSFRKSLSGEQLQRPLGKSGNTLFLSVQVDIVTFPHSATKYRLYTPWLMAAKRQCEKPGNS